MGFKLQPIVRVSDYVVDHYEQLARSVLPLASDESVEDYITAAERNGTMVSHDLSGFFHAIHVMEANRAMSIGINISGRTVCSQQGRAMLLSAARTWTRTAPKLVVEITETHPVPLADLAAFADGVRATGARISLDDVTPETSWETVESVRPNFIKMAGPWFKQCVAEPLAMRTWITDLHRCAETLGARLIAEHVETPNHLQKAEQLGFDLVQGYYVDQFAPPCQTTSASWKQHRF